MGNSLLIGSKSGHLERVVVQSDTRGNKAKRQQERAKVRARGVRGCGSESESCRVAVVVVKERSW